MSFAENIKAIRENKGWSQTQLANKLGVSRATVGNWEIGRRTPPVSLMSEIAFKLRVPLEDLITGIVETDGSMEELSEEVKLLLDVAKKARKIDVIMVTEILERMVEGYDRTSRKK